MFEFDHLFVTGHLMFLIPVVFLLLFTILFQTIESSYFFVTATRSLYPVVLAFISYLIVGEVVWPPEDFFQALVLAFLAMTLLFFFGKLSRFLFEIVILNGLLYAIFKDQINANLIFVVAVAAVINILFALLYGQAIGKKPIWLKIVHSLLLLALMQWAFYLNQGLVGQVAILCSLSIVLVTIFKLIMRKKVVPNFSRPIIDIGIPLVLLWVLLNASGLLFDYLSPYINTKVFLG